MSSSSTNIHVGEPLVPKVQIRQYELSETNSRVTVSIKVNGGEVTFFIPAPNDGSKTIHTFVEEICAALASPLIEIVDN
jgi:hypothetical protein